MCSKIRYCAVCTLPTHLVVSNVMYSIAALESHSFPAAGPHPIFYIRSVDQLLAALEYLSQPVS